MAKAKIKIRAKVKDGITQVKSLMNHQMETGLRKDSKTGEIIPAHYIQEVTCHYKGEVIMSCNWGPAVSQNPYMSFKFKGGAKGDAISISWIDNKGETATQEAKIK